MNEQPQETPTYRTLPDGRVLVLVDGVEYLHTGNFNFAKSRDTTDEVLRAFAAAIRKYHPNANQAEYIMLKVDGVKCYYWAGNGQPMDMELMLHKRDIRLNRSVVRMDNTADGYQQPIFYTEAVQYFSKEVRKELLAKLQRNKLAIERAQMVLEQIDSNEPLLDEEKEQKVQQVEQECKQHLVWMIKEKGARWPELLEAVKRHKSLHQPSWLGGKYGTPELLAAAAVDEALELSDIMETEANCGLRTMAEWLEMPYTLLLHTYTQLYIIKQKSQPIQPKYIPYELWMKTKQD